jgi:hypothetical protein
MKNSVEGFKGRVEKSEETISQFEERTMDTIKSEKQKFRRMKKQNMGRAWCLKTVMLDIQEAEIRKIIAPCQLRQQLGMPIYTCHPSYTGSIIKRFEVQTSWGTK